MIEFYRTNGGRRFIDHTIPDLILALKSVAVGLDRLSDLLEGARRDATESGSPPRAPGQDRG